jgi:hypothetical protein
VPGLDPNALHLINGDIAAGTFKQAIANTARLIIQRDVLSIGPTPAFRDMETWTRVRVEFWKDLLGGLPDIDFRLRDTDLSSNFARITGAGKVYVWAATGHADQLMITFLFELFEHAGADPGKVELIEFTQLPPGNRRVLAMGMLDAMQMRLHPAPRILQVEEWMVFRQAWRAISSDEPHKVERFSADNPQASEWLKGAVTQLLTRYPDRATGLNLWDRQLLGNVRLRGPRGDRIVAHTIGESTEAGDRLNDVFLFTRLLSLASPKWPKPLLVAVAVGGDRLTMEDTSFELTEFGAQVLDGKASSWPVNPIDQWAGGVHLSSAAGNVWFSEGGRIVRP